MVFKNGVKYIQAAAYNGACTVSEKDSNKCKQGGKYPQHC